ncbi:MAG: radical SAM protein [Candidatus Erginobacter occultus]|nr:radical SAM protein [Candidatus Erginobacter occultus]
MIFGNLKVARLAYRLYFRRATFMTRILCAWRLLKNRLFGIRAPISVMIGVTYRCQCGCVYCGMNLYQVDAEVELSTEEIKTVIEQARELGVVEITLFGGEPLLRDDLDEIVAFASSASMLPSIDTNGLLLTPERVESLMNARLSAVKVSMDSPEAGEHDRMRGVAGCFDQAVSGIRCCVERGLPCVISTYASRENIRSGDLRRVIELGKSLGVDAVRIIDTTLSGCLLAEKHKKLSPEDRRELASMLEPGLVFLENLASARALTHPVCSAVARRYIYVSPNGDVQPCCFVPLSAGNVREDPLNTILARLWNSPVMSYDPGRCLMNNHKFRGHYLPRIEAADSLPVALEE